MLNNALSIPPTKKPKQNTKNKTKKNFSIIQRIQLLRSVQTNITLFFTELGSEKTFGGVEAKYNMILQWNQHYFLFILFLNPSCEQQLSMKGQNMRQVCEYVSTLFRIDSKS